MAQELHDALATKSRFLANMSHEVYNHNYVIIYYY